VRPRPASLSGEDRDTVMHTALCRDEVIETDLDVAEVVDLPRER
jgi:hypothetical protein